MATKHTGSKSARHGREPRVPRLPIAQAREGQLAWVLGACERVLRPLVRLALAFGIKHAQLEEVLRDVLLDEARRAWLEQGTEPNISQLSVTTGLNRKAVTSRVREQTVSLPQTEMSAEARTLTLWLQMFADNPAHRLLPIVSDEESTPSFEAVARRASRGNVHHRAILDELVRLNMAIERDGMTELAVAGFVPASDLKGMLSFLGDNARDHLLAGVSNTVGAKPPLLERSVFAAGISLEECERIHRLARERWGELHHEMTREMRRAYEAADKGDSGRIRVGIYTYYEDAKAEVNAAQPVTRNSSESKK
ncbi:DUF6502 family protein [Variovorax sp. J22P240]|uniref:DUF6502 family protein n=1 Tax=Variovorax sp. J22P240 TaxID=3053514 RepID=UPI002578CADD|nr:DUF6502 family protein [Variovorax sp. J22P240]MDL9999311.1 DUF6502 family protein [Variovorax sp. J22P240]